ncbi:MAG: MBL fold metallo-hydrolase [Candidatus Bipolaricaulota bacterium]|nr:MBL fold metallo-hydrolase [Candidatus Bipolaricaulota bacterium]
MVLVSSLPLSEVYPGVWFLDTEQFGVPGQGGVYLLPGQPAALVEAGTSLAQGRILAALEELRIRREEVAWIFLTHIHLDHAGGAGGLLRELPGAKAVVHPRGTRHLVDPSRLVASVREAVRERFPLYGEAIPIPEDRIHAAGDGEVFPAGGDQIRAVETPGHAPHHLCYFAEGEKLLFTGDAAGLYLGGVLIPTTVPPSFDLELSLASLERMEALGPRLLLYTHFGPGDPALLGAYKDLLRRWVARVEEGWRAGVDEGALVAQVLSEAEAEGLIPSGPARGDLAMSVRGVLAYLRSREGRT